MTSPLPTATWPSISELETTSYPTPIAPAPIAVTCVFFVTIICLVFMLQPSKPKPVFRRDEEDCRDSDNGPKADRSTKVSKSTPPQQQHSSPAISSSVDRTLSSSSKWVQGGAKRADYMRAANSPSAQPSSPPPNVSHTPRFPTTTTNPQRFVNESAPLPPRSIADNNHTHLRPTARYPSVATSMLSENTGFEGSERRGLDIGTAYEGSFVPSILSDKRISHDPY